MTESLASPPSADSAASLSLWLSQSPEEAQLLCFIFHTLAASSAALQLLQDCCAAEVYSICLASNDNDSDRLLSERQDKENEEWDLGSPVA